MVATIHFLIFLTGFYPIGCAAWSLRKTTLLHALFWSLATWMVGAVVNLLEILHGDTAPILARYLAVGMIGCASVAVLGARRPGVGAWNFVIGGLLVVMLFLWLEGRLAEDDLILDRLRTTLLASTVAIGVINYLPTRLASAALMLAVGCGLEILVMTGSEGLAARLEPARPLARMAVAFVPWIGYVQLRRRPAPRSEFDQVWLSFRDSFGLVWAQRLREQFNHSAAHANWPVLLRWQGLRLTSGASPPGPEDRQAMLANLQALMKRFEIPHPKSQIRNPKSEL